jgi:hypothetical protein
LSKILGLKDRELQLVLLVHPFYKGFRKMPYCLRCDLIVFYLGFPSFKCPFPVRDTSECMYMQWCFILGPF